jgi:hypothetical protein
MSDDTEVSVPTDLASIHTPFRDPEAQIRLLHLHAKTKANRISVSLETWNIEDAPPYNAISYVWGSPSERQIITVDGVCVPVRKNCFRALQQARRHYPESYVWIDAICINQLDLEEKSTQVAMMGRIYKNASLVLACIGRADAFIQSSQAMYGTAIFQKTVMEESVWEWTERRENGTAGVMKVETSTMTHRWYPNGVADGNNYFPAKDEDLALITQLCGEWNKLSQRPYFDRAWVVQELVGGIDYVCGRTFVLSGRDSIGWTRLVTLCSRLNGLVTHPVTNLTTQLFNIKILSLNGLIYRGGFFTDYLEAMAYLECQDPRDRIFSVVSLIDWESYGQTPLFPDYRMSRSQLASELVWRLLDLNIDNVCLIARALDLGEKVYSTLERLNKAGLPSCPSGNRPDITQRWSCTVNGAYLIHRDTAGRFQIGLRFPLRTDIDFIGGRWPTTCDADGLAKRNAFPLFVGDTLVAFGSGRIHEGDILLSTDSFDLILRARSNASTFSIVGGAFVPIMTTAWLHQMRKATVCECWQETSEQYDGREVKVSVEATRAEALFNAVARDAIDHSKCGIYQYIKLYSIGAIRTGAHVWDTTKSTWYDGMAIGPPRPRCPQHKASELHRILRNPLWYTILSGGGPYVKTYGHIGLCSSESEDQDQQSSSSEWFTEED